MRDRAVVVAPGAGWEFDVPTRSVPSWVVEMSDEWRGSFKRFPRASIASMSGLAPIRAQKLLDGNVAPTPTEAATMDAALGTDASRLLPPRRPFVQGTALSIVAGRPRPPRTPPMTAPRQARVDAWAARLERSGLSIAAIARETGLGLGRCMRILRQGAVEDAREREALVAVLGDEP